jgi:ADP-ribose pyrophosphatase YjhB (NUDIX family)
MSYEPEVHVAQTIILRELLFTTHASFGALRKLTSLESDLFNFHLKKLIEHRYVEKQTTGRYALTVKGKTYANRMDASEGMIEKQPKLSVVVIIEDSDGKQLFQERRKQPYYGYWGHPTGKIRWGETIVQAAERELREETGLTAKLRVVGLYHKLDYDKTSLELREDKYFCIVHGIEAQGLLQDSLGCHNEWLTVQEFLAKPKRFGDPAETERLIHQPLQQIIENGYVYESNHY